MDKETLLPEKCPVCRKAKANLLLHIKKSESCNEKVDPDLYKEWKTEASKRKKRKYQEKYKKSGKAKEASKNFYKKRKEEDKESFRKIQNRDWCKYYNGEQVLWNMKKVKVLKKMTKKKASQMRRKKFDKFCSQCFYALSYGSTPCDQSLNKFHLVETELSEVHCEELHDWLSEINGRLLATVIRFQQIVLIPKSRWQAVLKKVQNQKHEDFILKVVGKLQAYKNENTNKIKIPCQFESFCHTSDKRHEGSKSKVATEDEEHFIKLMEDILVDQEKLDDKELQDLLRIRQAMKNLDLALKYTINDN